MVWFSNPWVAWCIYVPVTLAVRLLCHRPSPAPKPLSHCAQLQQELLGSALMNGGLAVGLMWLGAASSFLPALWAWTALLLWVLVRSTADALAARVGAISDATALCRPPPASCAAA